MICLIVLWYMFVAYSIIEIDMKFTSLDNSKFQAGKSEYELIHKKSQMPDYGKCWKDTIVTLNKDCKHVTADLQGKLALAYLNCFLEMQGLATYDCDVSQKFSVCAEGLRESDRNSLATFFTHTQNICYFLEAQVWHDQTEQTIGRLASTSQDVATQLEEASELQNEMIQQQKESIHNQEKMSEIISTSTDNINKMFDEFKNTTNEQRHLITDLFDKVNRLQSLVLGEFSGFYSIVYYTIMILMSYMLTSTPRTATARFWLFGIATVNILSERFALSLLSSTWNGSNEDIYMYQWLCRTISGCMALLVLAVSAYCYQDLNIVNNQLLLEIKKQNQQLREDLLGNINKEGISNGILYNTCNLSENEEITPVTSSDIQRTAADTTGYESDSGVSRNSSMSSTSLSSDTDHTYIPSSLSSVDSYSTCYSWQSSHTTLTDELSELHAATPVKQLAQQIEAWTKTGSYRPLSPLHTMESRSTDFTTTGMDQSRLLTSQPSTSQQITPTRYFLRSRTPIKENKVTRSESPRSFARTVKALEKITKKNSLLTQRTIKKTQNTSRVSDDS